MGGPSLWNSNIVSTLQEPVSNSSTNSSTTSPDGNVNNTNTVIGPDNNGLTAVPVIGGVSPIASSKKTSKSSPNSTTSSMVYKKKKLGLVQTMIPPTMVFRAIILKCGYAWSALMIYFDSEIFPQNFV